MQARACRLVKQSNAIASIVSSKDKRQSLACLAKVCPASEEGPSLPMIAGVGAVVAGLAWVGLRRRRG
jgi:MYXO-CTERM domain-containing protein